MPKISIADLRSGKVTVPERTSELLLRAAMAEFNDHGYSGTDTNRIARRAGFAPQTFYRWYKDKLAVFIAAYADWTLHEGRLLQDLISREAPAAELAEAGIGHHRAHLKFRRSLRQLSIEEPLVRAARAESRLKQIMQIRSWQGEAPQPVEAVAVMLLQLERLTDALAEGEFADMGLGEGAARDALAGLISSLRPR
jgi:AcrR family transcriptional regulator